MSAWMARAALAVLLLAVAACSSPPRSTVVLLDNPDGAASAVVVTTRGGSTRIDRPQQAVTFAGESRAPSAPAAISEAELRQNFARALDAAPEPPKTFLLYFKLDTAELTEDSQRQLPQVLDELRRRQVPEIAVVGHTDTTGTRPGNYQLGLRRAQAVRDAIVAIGVSPAAIQVSSHGDGNLLVPTPRNVAEQRNRRVELTVR